MKSLVLILFALTVWGVTGISQSFAQGVVTFGPKETKIYGSIPYSVIGEYKAQFSVFRGKITLNANLQRIQSVYLEIEASSIHSNCPWCDRVARSRRLLHTSLYPKIIFKSDKIIKDDSGYKVKGVLEMHGIKRRMIFPFRVVMMGDQKREVFDLKGSWIINRKDFNIVWSKLLDRGGILVGDYFTVNWGIKASI